MERYAWKATVLPGKLNEYIDRHSHIWPEMKQVLHDAGIRNYTIWNVGNELFGYYECDSVETAARVQAESAVVDKWNVYMDEIVFNDFEDRVFIGLDYFDASINRIAAWAVGMGLWLIQECRRDWIRAGTKYSWDEIVREAEKAAPLACIIDPDSGEFFRGGEMVEKIRAFCRRTGQRAPESVGEVSRCIYESLALKYRWALERLEQIKGRRIDTLNIVGGGIQNKLLNQMAADSISRPVVTGPVEGAAIGNLLAQAMSSRQAKT